MNITGEVAPVESSRLDQNANASTLISSGALTFAFMDNNGAINPKDKNIIENYTKRGKVKLDASKKLDRYYEHYWSTHSYN